MTTFCAFHNNLIIKHSPLKTTPPYRAPLHRRGILFTLSEVEGHHSSLLPENRNLPQNPILLGREFFLKFLAHGLIWDEGLRGR